MEGGRWSTRHPDGDQLNNTEEKDDQLSKGGTLEKGGRRKAKKSLGLDFMLRKIENDENWVGKASLAEAEKGIQGEASELEAKALTSGSGSGEEVERVEERKMHGVEEEAMRDGNEMLADDDEEAAAHSGFRLATDKKVWGRKKNLSLGFMLGGKPSKGVNAVEAINEPGLGGKPSKGVDEPGLESSVPGILLTVTDLGEAAATRDILPDRVSNSSLKLPAADKQVEGVKRNLGLGFMLKKPSRGETETVEMATAHQQACDGSISKETIEELTLVPAFQATVWTTNEDQMSVVGKTLESEFKLPGDGDVKNEKDFAALVDQVDKKPKHTFKKFLSIPKVKTGNSGMEKIDSRQDQQVWNF